MSFSSSMGAGVVWRKCSCRVAQSWELRNLSKAVAQAELRNPTSCASRVAQLGLRNPEKLQNRTLFLCEFTGEYIPGANDR